MDSTPTVFHITHWKAGSQWVAEILKYSAPERFIPYKEHGDIESLKLAPIIPGKVYGTVYLPKQVFTARLQNHIFPTPVNRTFDRHMQINWWNFGVLKKRYLPFVIIRDLRDMLVSLYFSVKHSHIMTDEKDIQVREELTSIDFEAGLLRLIRDAQKNIGRFSESAQIQNSWLGQPNILYLRYEDIIGHEHEFFERLIDYCKISVSREKLHAIVDHNLFEKVTGRQRGQEDVHAHLRRGVAGDWQNYFTEPLKQAFKQQFGDVLIKTGYEKDLNW